MKIFKKKRAVTKEPTSGLGYSAYVEMPEDFDYEAWVNAADQHIFEMSFRQKVLHFFSYMNWKIKSKMLGSRMSHIENDYFDEEFDDSDLKQTIERGLEIINEIPQRVQYFADQLINTNRSEIEYMNRRIVYFRKDHSTNSGFARYVEDLDGSNRFEYAWGCETGTRNQIIESIRHNIGYDLARVEHGSL